jgi:phospholipid/cholesterol/gamma-HCH transport system ATP-binding protein
MLLRVDSIVTKFEEQTVHDGVSFSIQKPSVVALIGGSGSGKSVLLREILGLLEPTAGKIELFGHDIAKLSPLRLEVLRNRYGVLFQDGALFSALTVKENLEVPFKEHTKLSPELVEPLIGLKLALSGLSNDVGLKMPSELSGGMRKRVALARALALEPELLFLDEPTSGLDPINARAFDSLIRTLCDSMGLTVFLITHDLDTLTGIVDRVIALAEGKVLADGTVQEVSRVNHPWIQSYFSSRTENAYRG